MNNEPELKYTVGIDIGGTNTQLAVVDSEGGIVGRGKFSTRDYIDINDFVARLRTEIVRLIEETGVGEVDGTSGHVHSEDNRVKGIGIGAPCVNYKTRCIENPAELPWKGIVPLADMLETLTGLPVWISNDANAAAIGEMIYGSARGLENFIEITLGTGVGSGMVVDGRVLNGAHGFAGELGHVTFPFAADRYCGCGRYGCLETCCSAGGVVETARRMMEDSDIPSELREIPGDQLTAKKIGDAFLEGDKLAASVFRFTEEALGKAFAEFCAYSDPEAIILFGGVADPRELNAGHIKEVMDEHMLYLYRDTKILFSTLRGSDAAILGAASLPWQKR